MNQTIRNRIDEIRAGKAPTGYKKTKVGVVPIDWEEKCLGKLGGFKKGGEVSGTNVVSEGLPAMMYGDIYVKYNFCFDKVDYRITKEIAEKSTGIHKNDLLFTCSGETAIEIGKCVCYQGDETVFIGGDILAFTPQGDNAVFLMYQQNIFPSIKQKARFGQGHSVVHIYKESIEKLSVAKPKSVNEQQKIAEVLMKWDEAIELMDKLVKKLEIRKKALIQRLLGKTGKDGWIKNRIGNYIKLQGGFAFKSEKYLEKGIPIVRISNIFDGKVDLTNCAFYAEIIINEEFIVKQKDIVLAMSGATIGKIGIYSNKNIAYLNQRVGKFINKDSVKFDYRLIKYIFISKAYFLQLNEILVAGAQPNISSSDIEKMKFYLPPTFSEQQHIAEILSAADGEIELNKQKLDKMREQKKALMQLLLTGIVRVK